MWTLSLINGARNSAEVGARVVANHSVGFLFCTAASMWVVTGCAARSTLPAGKQTSVAKAAPAATKSQPVKQVTMAKRAFTTNNASPQKVSVKAASSPVRKSGGKASAHTAGKKATIAKKSAAAKHSLPAQPITEAEEATPWRPRQKQPAASRYLEIQNALVAMGYLKPGQATGSWHQTSIEALKRFQAAKQLKGSGRITSLSLIALGLGPKHKEITPSFLARLAAACSLVSRALVPSTKGEAPTRAKESFQQLAVVPPARRCQFWPIRASLSPVDRSIQAAPVRGAGPVKTPRKRALEWKTAFWKGGPPGRPDRLSGSSAKAGNTQ
jgi:hypothetical protein